MPVSGILLAGGKSTRLGRDKRFILLGNKKIPLWQYAVNLLEEFTTDIIISAPQGSLPTSHPVIQDIIPDIGPMGGLYTCLPKIKHQAAIVIPVDMPLLSSEILSELLKNYNEKNITIARHSEKIEPLVGIYPAETHKTIAQLIQQGNYKIRNLFTYLPVRFVDFPDTKEFLNLNRPSDLKEINKHITLL